MKSSEPEMDHRYTSQRSSRDSSFPFDKTFPNNYSNLPADLVLPVPSNPIFFDQDAFSRDPIEMSENSSTQYFMNIEQEAKIAGMKIFATIMLNAWRRRREDAKRLAEKVEDLKKCSMKAKNQLHVYNTLFRVEQKRNDELTCQLKHSMDNINQAKTSCEGLTTSVISLKADKALLEQELRIKYKEADGLNCVLAQTKADLYDSLVEQRKMQVVLRKEQRNVQFLENQKNKLINEICDLGAENRKIEEKFHKELERKNDELQKANEENEVLEVHLIKLKEKAFWTLERQENEARLRLELQQMRAHVEDLKKQLDQTLGSRWKVCRKHISAYQKTAWRVAHLMAFYLLPATPPPDFLHASRKLTQ